MTESGEQWNDMWEKALLLMTLFTQRDMYGDKTSFDPESTGPWPTRPSNPATLAISRAPQLGSAYASSRK